MFEFMKEAIIESEKNLITNDGGPFGAVIVKDGEIIGRGHNEVLKNNDPTCHAEIQAIRDASKNLNSYDLAGCELYTSCYPCPMCISAAIWANIKIVYYGNSPDDAANIGFRDDYIYKFLQNKNSDENVIKLSQLNWKDTIVTFKQFKLKKNKIIY